MSQRKNPYLANFLAVSSLALGIALPAFGQMPPGGPTHPREVPPLERPGLGGPMPFLRGLDLSDAQDEQIFRIFHEQAPALREQMKNARRVRQQMNEAVHAEKFDRARVRELAQAHGKALAELEVMHAESMRKVREVLTAEQRARLDERERNFARGPR
jgi:periplasmic protein CpxP/Spy